MNFAGLANCLNDTKAIHEEFALVPVVHARMDELPPGGETKNRYANVIPLPETRVPMTKRGSDPLSEYINANFVRVSGKQFDDLL
jgi:protein tyrosine phosphatase